MQTKIPAFDYKGGRSITEKLKSITKVDEFQDLADVFDIPRSTISTWHTRNMTPYEILVRTHLATGVSLKWLALDEGEPFEQPTDGSIEKLSIEVISNGALEVEGSIKLDLTTLQRYRLKPSSTKVVEQNENLYFVNTSETNPTVGNYLIDIDESISINQIQRLPGKRLALIYGNTSIEVSEDDIEVLGKIVMTMGKE